MEEKYIELLDYIVHKIDEIDGNTPWQTKEPEWWLNMMELRDIAQKQLDGYDND